MDSAVRPEGGVAQGPGGDVFKTELEGFRGSVRGKKKTIGVKSDLNILWPNLPSSRAVGRGPRDLRSQEITTQLKN